MTTTPLRTTPATLLIDTQAVLAAALAFLSCYGWQRKAPTGIRTGLRLVDAVNIGSAAGGAYRSCHLLAFACVAMAVELHTGTAAHALLPEQLADVYLSPDTDDDTLHRLDASILVRYNAEHCTGTDDAAELLRIAFDAAPQVLAAQHAYGRVTA